MARSLSPVLPAFAVGIALASAPGPVQAVLLTEAVRGGVTRGLRALAGTSVTFLTLLVALALGLSVAPPGGLGIRVLKTIGGVLLLWLAADGLRSGHKMDETSTKRRGLHPTARGVLAIVLNPGAWLFLGTVASPLFASATQEGDRVTAVLAAVALGLGATLGDLGVVLLGGLGLRRGGQRIILGVQRVLAALLFGLGVWLIIQGVVP
jgi:threonine/homoserine/homoserine lactone efflux protein